MAKRVAVILSGCGAGDGSDVRESMLTLLSLERAGAEAICAAPDLPQPYVHDHLKNAAADPASPRLALNEAARIAGRQIRSLADLKIQDVDGLIFPGGVGVAWVLSNYADKGQVCDVEVNVARLLKEALASHRPLGFIGLSPILAARVLGPVAGVRVTLPRTMPAAKHAAVMGADVRPCAPNDVFIDKKNRVISTPAYLAGDIRLGAAAQGIEKLVRNVLQLARDRNAPGPASSDRDERNDRPAPGGAPAGRPGGGSPQAPAPKLSGGSPGGPILRRSTPARGSV